MTKQYHIFTDAACDVAQDVILGEEIGFVPMSYTLDEEELVAAGQEPDERLKAFYDSQRNGRVPRTSQISPQNYADFFGPYAERGESVLYICLSGGLSGTYQSAQIAAEDLKERYPAADIVCVDSRSASIGIGLLVEAAAGNRAAGMSIHENAAWLEAHRMMLQHWFMVDDLLYLMRGGRLSAATAMVGVVLSIKPILKIEPDGTLINFEKKRGAKAGLARLVELYKSYREEAAQPERLYVVHADNPQAADQLAEAIRQVNPQADVVKMQLGPVIGAHVGPGMCAIVHWGKESMKRG